MSIPIWDNSNGETVASQKYNCLRDLATEINRQSYKNNAQEQITRLLDFAESENIEELREFRQCEHASGLLVAMDWLRAQKIIENTSNPVACEFIMSLEYLLQHDYHSAPMTDISSFRDWLEKYTENGGYYHIRRMYAMELKSVIKETFKQ